jgi:hypothetical protein
MTMQFIFQPLTWGFFLVLLPLLIHLINLMRQKRVQWAAMDFLMQSEKKHKTWVWLKQLLLLLARMAAIALLVAMLAHLATRSQWSNFFGGRTTHHIVLLDDSFSMSDRIGSDSAWDRANRVVTQLAQHVAAQDTLQRFTLIRFSRAGTAQRPSDDQQPLPDDASLATAADMIARTVDAEFEATLEDVRRDKNVSALASSPHAALDLARTIIEQSDNESHDIYLVSDFRADHWQQPGDLADALTALDGKEARLNLVRCSQTPHSNVTITELSPVQGVQAAGVPLFVEVAVKNFGVDVARQVTVALRVMKTATDEATVDASTELPGILIDEIGPGETVSRRAQVFFTDPGQHVLAAELSADAVAVDNRRWCVIDCEDGIPVLVIDGDPDRLNVRYLETVFQPSDRVRTGIRVDLESATFLRDATPAALAKYHAIYLLDVPRMDDRAARNVEKFVKDGGGIAIFLGPESDLSFYNGWHAEGEGLFPLPLSMVGTLPSSTDGTPDLQVENHPLFRVLLGERNAFIGSIRIQQYATPDPLWQPTEETTVSVIAKLRNGDPLWVEQRFGSGRVVTQLSSLAPRWNSWATQPTFPVLMLELQSYLNTSRQADPDRFAGAPIEMTVDAREYQPQVDFQIPMPVLATPNENTPLAISLTRNVEVEEVDGRQVGKIVLDSSTSTGDVGNTETPGVYGVKLQRLTGEFEKQLFAINVDASESNLELASMDALSKATSGTGARILDSDAISLSARDDNRFSWSQILLFALVGLLIVEQLLAYSASYHPGRHTIHRRTAYKSGAVR